MGISIHAIVDPSCISTSAWARVYDETVEVLRKWPAAPLRRCNRTIAGTDLIVLTRDVVQPDGWCICGDADSRLTAESIQLSRALGVEAPLPPPSPMALRVLQARRVPSDPQGLQWLLDGKTQAKPFHTLVLAIAMLIEHRLPHAAFVGGDFTADDTRRAQAHLHSILGETIALPLCTEPQRLQARLAPHLQGEALDESVRSLTTEGWGCRGARASIFLGLLTGALGSRPHQEIEQAVGCTDVSMLDELTRESFEFLIGQSKALFGMPAPDGPSELAAFPAELAGLDAAGLLQTIACGTRATRLTLTEMAWEDIRNASLNELCLLAMLSTRQTSGLIAHQLRRAVFESCAIRALCLDAWSNTAPVSPEAVPVRARLFDESRPPYPEEAQTEGHARHH